MPGWAPQPRVSDCSRLVSRALQALQESRGDQTPDTCSRPLECFPEDSSGGKPSPLPAQGSSADTKTLGEASGGQPGLPPTTHPLGGSGGRLQSQDPALRGGEASPGAGAGGAGGEGNWPCFCFLAGWPQSCLEPQGGPAGAPAEQKACSRHWPGIQPPLTAAWDQCAGVGVLCLAQPRCGTYLVPAATTGCQCPVPSAQSFRGQGGAALGCWALCPALPVGLGGAREEGAGKGLWPHLHVGPWPLSSPPHCVPGLAHNHSLCGGLSHPGELKHGGGPGPPPASKGKFLLLMWASPDLSQGTGDWPQAGTEPELGGRFCCVEPPPPSPTE